MMGFENIANCYLCNKPLDITDLPTPCFCGAGYFAIEVRRGGVVGVHEQCIDGHNRMLSREAFLRVTNRRVQNRQTGW
jgi:hypothetical protein